MPKISVIIPVYNVEKYLQECLDSVINQTFSDIEIICINDGSTDNSLRILEENAQKDNRIKIINQENQGQGVARNKGLDAAQGEYIAFVDSDDYIDLDTYEIVYKKFKETNADIVQFDYITCRENSKTLDYYTLANELKNSNINIEDNECFCLKNFRKPNFIKTRLFVCDKVYSSKLTKNNNIKFAENKIGEDHIFSISSTLLANKILYINKYFYHYRQLQDSSVHKISNDNFSVFDNTKLIKDFLIKNNLYNKYKSVYEKYLVSSFVTQYKMLPKDSEEKYLGLCKQILNKKSFYKFLRKIQPKRTFLQKIYSIKNYIINNEKYKFICFFSLYFLIRIQKENTNA